MNIMSFLQTYVCQSRARKKKEGKKKEKCYSRFPKGEQTIESLRLLFLCVKNPCLS